jgi:hypothetical protein
LRFKISLMKSKLLSALLVIAVYFLVDFLFFKLEFSVGEKPLFIGLSFIFRMILLFILFEIFLYKKVYDFKSGKLKVFFFCAFPLLISILLAERLQVIDKYYHFSKTLPLRAGKNLFQFNETLAHKTTPGAKGSYIYYITEGGVNIKDSVPVFIDANGFRTVPDSCKLKSDTLDLYLGCSFTFGDFLDARFGYPYVTSKLLGHNYFNAGVSAYGIGQMKILGDRLLEKNKFKYVFIQLSPWLVQRAMQLNGPMSNGYRPFPYFSDGGEGFKLNFPAFTTSMYKTKNLRDNEASYFEKLKFILTDGRKTEINEYTSFEIAKLKISMGLLPKPTERKAELEKYFYSYTIDLCKKHHAIPVLVKIGYPDADCKDLLAFLKDKALIIDTDTSLNSMIKETGKEYKNLFSVYHVAGKDTFRYDNHPNKLANELFALKIYKELRK